MVEMKVLVALIGALAAGAAASASGCKCFPGDACWPSSEEWSRFNSTVGGRLVATVPLGQPCHDPWYNATTCDYLKTQWEASAIQWVNPD